MRVLIADDNPVVLRALSNLLQQDPQMEVCGTAKNGKAAVEQFRRLRPDVVVLDYVMPEMNGMEAARQIHSLAPQVAVLMCTLYPSATLAKEAKKAGVTEVLFKGDLSEHLLRSVRAVVPHSG